MTQIDPRVQWMSGDPRIQELMALAASRQTGSARFTQLMDELRNDSRLRDVMDDPDIVRALNSAQYRQSLRDPRIQAALNNPALAAFRNDPRYRALFGGQAPDVSIQPASPAPTTPAPPPLTPVQEGARAFLNRVLSDMGLGSLGNWAWEQYLGGMLTDQIFIEMRDRPEYQARFPAMRALAEKGRAISEAEYIAYEKQVTASMRAAGLPVGFYDQPEDFANLLQNEVSPAEVESRITLAAQAAFSWPAEEREELERLWGVGPGDLVAFWLDPDRTLPLLEQRGTSAQLAAQSRRAGYGPLAAAEAERLAQVGITPEAAGQAFGELAGLRETFGALTRGEEEIGRGTQLGLIEGSAESLETIRKRQARRVGAFEAGGDYAATREGISGVGRAR